nr:hypothetical protein [Janthinobacterium sp. Marseille]
MKPLVLTAAAALVELYTSASAMRYLSADKQPHLAAPCRSA